MSKINTRTSGALAVVFLALILASMACYSGQIPGVLELTPYHTETPLPVAQTSRFQLGQMAFIPPEAGRASFNLTVYPEPLQDNLVNSKSSCLPNSSAEILYVGQGNDGNVYYLIVCGGSVGWSSENRLAGPVAFNRGQLALTLAQPGQQMVKMLDSVSFQPMFLQQCRPGSIVSIISLEAKDTNNDGNTEIFYEIECPLSNRGMVTDQDLFGPLEIDVDDRALALDTTGAAVGSDYLLASEPAEVTEANAIPGCTQGAILTAKEIKLVENTVYYRMACGEVEGWTSQERFVGPLLFDTNENTIIYTEPVQYFLDQLPPEVAAELGIEEVVQTDTTAVEEGEAVSESQREVVEYTPPLYLTNEPGVAIPVEDNTNVVGRCAAGQIAHIDEYVGFENEIYYSVSCDECVATEENVDGELVCTAYETRSGWVPQTSLKGPINFVPGDKVVLVPTSKAVLTDEETGAQFARIPNNRTGAFSIGQNTTFSGRCPLESPLEVISVALEKDNTRDAFSFYYEVQCTGEPASYRVFTDTAGKTRSEVSYAVGESQTLTGWFLAKDIALSAP